MILAPETEDELLTRANALSGRSLASIAAEVGVGVPGDLKRAKGWMGQLVESALGAYAASRAAPDFAKIGIELKTVPVGADGIPRETTFVCTLPLDVRAVGVDWESCWVRNKLAKVLWIPIAGNGAPGDRTIGRPKLWSPTALDLAELRADWEGVREAVSLGELWQLDGKRGRVLQVRPKGAHGGATTWAQDSDAEWVRTTPLAFYLRSSFTRRIFQEKPS